MARRISVAFIVVVTLLGQSAAFGSAVTPKQDAKGSYGQTLMVNQTDIKQDGKIIVSGRGFDTNVGLYLSLCKQPGKGLQPTPCGGGSQSTAATGSAIWIANNAPTYASNLVKPFGDGGTFRFELEFQPIFGGVDCRKEKCVITIRADHLRSGDRSHDVFIPVTFENESKAGQSKSKKSIPIKSKSTKR